ncbi:cystathionine beta-lyase [Orrella sp. NBD-18]|uniref:Cystathionine beta-lyase n=1 Tax=Sheuella amnicola TaxID=2707330 RepID=A0A6B2QXN9_9BURK|nr:cystathionine beta-lyase [Sheuella amnicola]NDY82438.1 cystathionine beta-lyase [Sheuella amnicola]
MKDSDKKTRLMRSGRSHEGWVNVPPTRASTYVFPTVEAWRDTRAKRETERLRSYGARGTDSTHALEDILIELEGGFRAALFPTGQAAIAVTLLGFLSPGDHLLMTDAAYEPVRRFCSEQLKRLGIEVTYYLPDGSDLKSKIQKNTKVIYVECPGSLTYDMLDLKDVSTIARQHHCVTIADNTWGSGWLYRPLELGADVSIIAATKYLSGHSDVMMGVAVSNKEAWPLLQKAAINFGQTVGADDAYLVSRGIRTLPVRMLTHEKNALIVAQWLKNQKEVSHVFCPALSTDENHEIWQRDCKGTNGLLTVEFHPVHAIKQIEQMIDALTLFGLGASWGGFESLVIPANMNAARSLTDWTSRGQVVRFHIGLEDPVDLIKDLEQAFKQFHL